MNLPASEAPLAGVAAVVIGRNEGERLRRCLLSLRREVGLVVYVDSGSTDGSRELARGLGVETVELDLSRPFTAARARNAGFAAVRAADPAVALVQFVDGDCEVQPRWLGRAAAYLQAEPQAAVVAGRRRERWPERSLYNRLCDLEWAVPAGPARACGGDAMFRADALAQVGGYRDTLIAGEEPELCVRLRAAGWRVQVLAEEMTLHDAAMTRFRQWWLRSVRAGHAYAEGAALHGAPPECHGVRETRRALAWGVALPAAVALLAPLQPWALLLLALYPAQVLRLAARPGGPWRLRAAHAGFLVIGKFAEAQGILRYWRHRLVQRQGGLIEYK